MANSNVFGVDIQAEVANAVRGAINEAVTKEVTRTIGTIIQEQMAASGTQEAAAFNVTVNGVTHQVVSDDSPALTIEVEPTAVVNVEKLNSAAAGLVS